jgi:hypothetical protein
MFGEAYSLQVESAPDDGTAVMLPLPLPKATSQQEA